MFCFTRYGENIRQDRCAIFFSFVANLLQYLCAKNYGNIRWFDKVIAVIKGCNFFAPQCRMNRCHVSHNCVQLEGLLYDAEYNLLVISE